MWYETELRERGWTEEQIQEVVNLLDALDFTSEYEFADNHRFARPDNPTELSLYDDYASRGCCGSYDAALPSGIKVGFNYGH